MNSSIDFIFFFMTSAAPNIVLEFLPDDTKIACPMQTLDLRYTYGILIVKCTTAYTVLLVLPDQFAQQAHVYVSHTCLPIVQWKRSDTDVMI